MLFCGFCVCFYTWLLQLGLSRNLLEQPLALLLTQFTPGPDSRGAKKFTFISFPSTSPGLTQVVFHFGKFLLM